MHLYCFMLSSHLRLGLLSGLFLSNLPTKALYAPLFSPPLTPTCYIHRLSNYSRFYRPNNISLGVHIIKLHTIWFSPIPCYLVPLRPKYSPQHPVLKTRKPTTPQCERPSCTLSILLNNTAVELLHQRKQR